MTSRARHVQATRLAILGAAYELLLENEGTDFSVQEVADRAGITHRSVYRYFPSREELLIQAAVSRIFPEQVQPTTPSTTLREWIDTLGPRFRDTEEHFRLLRQVLGAVLASDSYVQRVGEPSERFAHEWQLFRSEFPHLADEEAQAQFAIFRQLGSSMTYIAFRTDFGLSVEEAIGAIQATLRRMADDLATNRP